MPDKFIKDSSAVLDFGWDWSTWLGETETIISADVTITPDVVGGIAVDSIINDGTSVIAWLSGGADYAVYLATCAITTSQGRSDERSMIIECTFR